MTALFEGGNSHLHFAWWDGGQLVEKHDLAYGGSPNEIGDVILKLTGGRKPCLVAACSVSLVWGGPLFRSLGTLFPENLRIAVTAADAHVRVRYDHPGSYGIDRALAAAAAYHEERDACVVVDAGTAVTVDAVDGDGTVLGGYIFPGVETLAHGLASRTGLPFVPFDERTHGVGTSTQACIGHAIAEGFPAAVRALVGSASAAAGGTNRTVFTGGGGAYLARVLGYPDSFRPDLALRGLGLVSEDLPKYA